MSEHEHRLNKTVSVSQTNEIKINRRGFFSFHHGYPWASHFAMLFPICVYVIAIGIMYGFFGDGPRVLHQVLRESYPTATYIMSAASHYAELPLYAVI